MAQYDSASTYKNGYDLDALNNYENPDRLWDTYGLDRSQYDVYCKDYDPGQDPAVLFKEQYGAEAAESFYHETVSQADVEKIDQQYLEDLMEMVESPLDQL